VAWPVVTETCVQPFKPATWLAALQVMASRCGGQPEELADLGLDAFTGLVRPAVPGWGGQRVCGPVCQAVFCALTSAEGWCARTAAGCCAGSPPSWATCNAPAPSSGTPRPAWPPPRAQQRDTEAAMAAALASLGLAGWATYPA
jgi:hypothetical protein